MQHFNIGNNYNQGLKLFDNLFNDTNKQFRKSAKVFDRHIESLAFFNQQKDKSIEAVVKNTQFQYQSFFFLENIYANQPNSPVSQISQETNETQSYYHKADRKGFQFSQYPANSPIQDSSCTFQIPELKAFVFSIFDGHGGYELSRFCAKNFSKYLQKFVKNGLKLHKYQNNKIQLIKDGLSETHFQLQKQFYKIYLKKIQIQKKKFRGVGTCAITVVLFQGKCIVATCGDSQAISISEDRGSYNYEKLSERYNVNNKTQRQRLIKEFKDTDENILVEQRKNVFYLKGTLQPTKSIGDYYLKKKQHYIGQDQFKGPYLNCEPDIKVYDIKEHDKHIVVASDGLWDYLSKWQVLKHIIESKNEKINFAQRQTESQNEDEIQSAPIISVKYLTQKILQKVSNDFDLDINYLKSLELGDRRSHHDDITIGIIDLKQFFQHQTNKN